MIERLDLADDRGYEDFYATYVQAHGQLWESPYGHDELRVDLEGEPGNLSTTVFLARDESAQLVGVGWIHMPLRTMWVSPISSCVSRPGTDARVMRRGSSRP